MLWIKFKQFFLASLTALKCFNNLPQYNFYNMSVGGKCEVEL